MNTLISVVVPIYNSENFLERCLDSIGNQSYSDFEVVLIDDGSTDKSGMICDAYQKKKPRVKVVHQENKGLVETRKVGVKWAEGRYIAFVDSDDWLDEDYIERFTQGIQLDEDVDIITSGAIYEYDGYHKAIKDGCVPGHYNEEEIKGKIVKGMVWDHNKRARGIEASLWAKLIKRDVLIPVMENIDSRITIGEDGVVIYPLLVRVASLIILDYCGYHYRQRDDSMLNKKDIRAFEKISYMHDCMNRQFQSMGNRYFYQDQIDAYTRTFLHGAIRKCFGFSMNAYTYRFPFEKIKPNERIMLYGAGRVGKSYYEQVQSCDFLNLVAWVDRQPTEEMKELGVLGIDGVENIPCDKIVIAIAKKEMAGNVQKYLLGLGIPKAKIVR